MRNGAPPSRQESAPPADILIVEDDVLVAEDVRRTIENLGYRVADAVTRGEEAVEVAREQGPDLILMDVRLAGPMDGVEAASTIVEELDIPVVYMTAYADDETRDRIRQTTPYGYVVKPFTTTDLQTTMEVALDRHRLDSGSG